MTTHMSLEPAFVVYRLNDKQTPTAMYRDPSAPRHLQDACVWVREPFNRLIDQWRWMRFTGQDVIGLIEDLRGIKPADENRVQLHGSVTHASRVVHTLQVNAINATRGEHDDYRISLGLEWLGLPEGLEAVIEKHCSANNKEAVLIHTANLGKSPDHQEQNRFMDFLQYAKKESYLLDRILRIKR